MISESHKFGEGFLSHFSSSELLHSCRVCNVAQCNVILLYNSIKKKIANMFRVNHWGLCFTTLFYFMSNNILCPEVEELVWVYFGVDLILVGFEGEMEKYQ